MSEVNTQRLGDKHLAYDVPQFEPHSIQADEPQLLHLHLIILSPRLLSIQIVLNKNV